MPTAYPTYRYVWGTRYIDELIYRDQCNTGTGALVQRLYAMQDANYNVVALAEEDGDVVERFIYDAYGKVTVLDPAFTADADNASDYAWTHLYTGRPLDGETGLMDYRNRCYHTGLGRFVTRDPVGYLGNDWNFYGYVWSCPARFCDPLGLEPMMMQQAGQTAMSGAAATAAAAAAGAASDIGAAIVVAAPPVLVAGAGGAAIYVAHEYVAPAI